LALNFWPIYDIDGSGKKGGNVDDEG